MPSPSRPDRGATWVWIQAPLLLALVASGPASPAAWHSPSGLALGALAFVAAGAIGIPAVFQLGRNRTPFPCPRDGSSLVQTGLYAWVRHPLYVSVLLAAVSWTLLWQSLWTALFTGLCLAFFDAKARREERFLADAFPSYPEYCRRVKRFLPGIY
ncbi:MAG: isoprenylcysteine carboxylmethyltransferase family protein [Verrucomicrobiales bacterium]|nr:isoprenylcysteine carboxylmethyltransferase family protein [Verrucomicrobiales bacterium]